MTYDVRTQDVTVSTTVSGTVAPAHSTTVTAPAAGKIATVYKKVGDRVTAGEIIARIDDTDHQDALRQAEFHYRSVIISAGTADLTNLAQTKTQLENAVDQARAQQLSAEINLKNAVAKDASDTTMDSLQDAVTQAEESLVTAQDNLKYLQDSSTASSASQSGVAVQQAQLSLKTAEDQLVADAQAGKDTTADLVAVNSARLSLESASASASADTSVAQNNLKAAQLEVTQAERAVTAAKRNLAAGQVTVSTSANDLEPLKASVEQANESLAAAKANLAAFPETVRKYNFQVQSNDEQKEEALYALNAEKKKAGNYVITAPMSGVITTMSVAAGGTVASGATIAKLTDWTTWDANVSVDEMNVIKLKAGQDASVTIDPYGDKAFHGKIISVGYASTSSSQNSQGANLPYTARIQLTDPPSSLMTGMKCDASIILSVAKNVLAVPVESVISDNGKYYVMVVSSTAGADKKQPTMQTTRKEVKVGIASDDYIQIISGLKAGDRILRNAGVSSVLPQQSKNAGSVGLLG
jgi:HlyD family secretion protein